MQPVKVWDPFVRVFHWAVVAGFAANALFTDPEGWRHAWIGYAIGALVALRVVWGMIGGRHARFADFPPNPGAALVQLVDIRTGTLRLHVGHTPLGALMIYNLLLTLSVIVATGWGMTTDAFWGVAWVEELHELAAHWAEVSVVLHVAAVLWETRRSGVNLPKAMVTGYKVLPIAVPEDR